VQITEVKNLRVNDRMYYTVAALGKTRKITPEGYLLCEGVPIARTGIHLYKGSEILCKGNLAGEVRVERTPEEVFKPESMASFEGKPVVMYHPDEFMEPGNIKQHQVGTMMNVRQGEGFDADCLVADLLITNAGAIAYANKEFPELSAGYNADYVQTTPGYAIQKNIIGNHVAFVSRGRAGARCAIRDHLSLENLAMTTKSKKRGFVARIMTAIKANDPEAIQAELDELEQSVETKDSQPNEDDAPVTRKELKAVTDGIAELRELITKNQQTTDASMCTECKETKGNHTAACSHASVHKTTLTADQLRDVVSRAEILAPGIQVPTADSLTAKDAAPTLMRSALEKAMGAEDGKDIVEPFLMGRDIKTLDGDSLLGVFTGAATLKGDRNNQRTAHRASIAISRASVTADSVNTANKKFWENRK
jgi:hypothetical protein